MLIHDKTTHTIEICSLCRQDFILELSHKPNKPFKFEEYLMVRSYCKTCRDNIVVKSPKETETKETYEVNGVGTWNTL